MKKIIILIIVLSMQSSLQAQLFVHDRAVALMQQGKFQDAKELLKNNVAHQSHNASFLYDLGVASYKTEDFNQAKAYFEQIANAPDVSSDLKEKAYFNCGNCMVDLNQLEKAIDCYKNALEINPEDKQAKHNLEKVKEMLEKQKQEQKNNKDKNKQDKENKDKQENQDKENQDKQDQGSQDKKDQEQNNNKEDKKNQDSQDNNKKDDEENGSQGDKKEQEKNNQSQQNDQNNNGTNNKPEKKENKQNGSEKDQDQSDQENEDRKQEKDKQQKQNGGSDQEKRNQEQKKEQGASAGQEQKKADDQKRAGGNKKIEAWLAKMLDDQEKNDAAMNK